MLGSTRYSPVSVIGHWITALAVAAMLTLGWAAALAPDEVTEDYIIGFHTSLGFFIVFVVAARVAIRLYEGFAPALGEALWEWILASTVQRTLLLALVVMVITGPMYLFTEHEAIEVFGLFSVYIPLGGLSFLHEPVETVHVVLGLYILPALIGLHLLGAARMLVSTVGGAMESDVESS